MAWNAASVVVSGNHWVTDHKLPYQSWIDFSRSFPAVTGTSPNISYGGIVPSVCDTFHSAYPSNMNSWYTPTFVEGTPANPQLTPTTCFVAGGSPSCPAPLPNLYLNVPAWFVYQKIFSAMVQQSVFVPTSETTTLVGTYQITEGLFEMTLNPGAYNYDGHYVTENNYAQGTNTCWWQGADFVQHPQVVGSTWTVGQNGAGHDQYGLDTIGFDYGIVNEIQTQGPDHGIDFPCVVTIYQEMTYEVDANTFYDYAENVLTQTMGSNTVRVCRANVCTATIPF